MAQTLDLPAGVVKAMKRDLKLTSDEQVAERLRTEAAAPVVQKRLKAKLGNAYGGAWIKKGEERLTVAVTSEAAAKQVRAEGAEAEIVDRGEGALAADRAKLDKRAAKAADAIRALAHRPGDQQRRADGQAGHRGSGPGVRQGQRRR